MSCVSNIPPTTDKAQCVVRATFAVVREAGFLLHAVIGISQRTDMRRYGYTCLRARTGFTSSRVYKNNNFNTVFMSVVFAGCDVCNNGLRPCMLVRRK